MVLISPAAVHVRELHRLELLDHAAHERHVASAVWPGYRPSQWQRLAKASRPSC
jgi:hypothetical protein